jgi:integrase
VDIPIRSDLPAPPPNWHAGPRSSALVDRIIYARVVPATRAREATVLKRLLNYLEYRLGRDAPLLPARKEDILSWLGETSGHVTYGTVQSWVSDLKRVFVDMDVDCAALDSAWFRGGLKGLRKIKGNTKPRQAMPIPLPALSMIVASALRGDAAPSVYQLTIAAALSLGFGCFLRSGEFTYDKFDPTIHLRRRDVNLATEPPTLRIRFSKMDRVGQGRTVPIPRVTNPRLLHLCPVTLLRRLFAAFPVDPEAPLFSLSPSRLLPYFPASKFIAELRFLLAQNGIRDQPDGRVYSGHSLRRGAATWAAELGYSDNEIMHLGRWSPTTMRGGHQRYVEPTIQRKAELAGRLMSTFSGGHAQRALGFQIADDDVDDLWHQL